MRAMADGEDFHNFGLFLTQSYHTASEVLCTSQIDYIYDAFFSILRCSLVTIHFHWKEKSNMNILHLSFCGLQKKESLKESY